MIAAVLLALLVQDRPMLPAPDDDSARTRAAPDEILVEGKRDMTRFRTGPIDDARWAEKPLRPDFKLPGGARGAVRAEQRALPGASAPAAMVTVRIPLGRRAKKK